MFEFAMYTCCFAIGWWLSWEFRQPPGYEQPDYEPREYEPRDDGWNNE